MAGALLGLAGSAISAGASMGAAGASKDIAGLEMQIIEQQRLQMRLEADRRRLETVRSMQRARAVSLATAVAQGAQNGTALMGAYGQISGQGTGQILAVNQNQAIGENIFDLNSQISQKKMDIADFQTMSAFGSGVSSLGGAISGAMGKHPGVFGGSGMGGSATGGSMYQASPSGMNPWYSQIHQFNPNMLYDKNPYPYG